MPKAGKDQYINVAYGTLTMSAANTLTFASIQLAIGLFQGIALCLHRVLFDPGVSTLREIVAATDELHMALTTSNRLTSITNLNDPAILSKYSIIGIAANTEVRTRPIIVDYSTLPMGGKLIAANPLYFGMSSGGFAAAGGGYVGLEFTFVELSDKDYIEVVQSQFPVNLS